MLGSEGGNVSEGLLCEGDGSRANASASFSDLSVVTGHGRG